jgi:hypothetical protein
MPEHEDLSAFEILILALLLDDDDPRPDKVREPDAQVTSVIGTHQVRPGHGH